MTEIKQNQLYYALFDIFHDLINSKVTDPESSSRNDKYTKWIFSCVDKDTECLTEDGWKNIDLLKDIDKIYTYEGKFELLLKINKYDVKDLEMVKVETRDLSMLLSPNHRVFCWQRSSTERKYPKIILAEDMKNNVCIPQLKEATFEPEGEIYSDEFIELLGWIITEGFIHKRDLQRGISIYQSQSANPKYVIMIRSLLIELGMDFTEHKRERKEGCIEIEFYIKTKDCDDIRKAIPNKMLSPKLIFDLNKNQRRLLIETMVLGDGSIGSRHQFCYIQKGKHNIDMFAMLATLAGYRTNVSKSSGEDMYVCYVTSKSYTCIRQHNGAEIKREKYSGVIWCPSIKSGIFLARKDGKMFFTGNSYPDADIAKNKIIFPIIVIEPADNRWEQFTQTKSWNKIEMTFSVYHTHKRTADLLLGYVTSVVDSNKTNLRTDNGLTFVNLEGTDTDFDMLGGTRVHIRSADFSMQNKFNSGLGKVTVAKTINSNAEVA